MVGIHIVIWELHFCGEQGKTIKRVILMKIIASDKVTFIQALHIISI